MVSASIIPKARWDRHIQKPPIKSQITFMRVDKHPWALFLYWMWLPNGHKAKLANFKVCNPNGIPTMVIIKIKFLYFSYFTIDRVQFITFQRISPAKHSQLLYSSISITEQNIISLEYYSLPKPLVNRENPLDHLKYWRKQAGIPFVITAGIRLKLTSWLNFQG